MTSSTLDPDAVSISDRELAKGHDNQALGPGDTSDSGSDMTSLNTEADTDSHGTGERGSVEQTRNAAAPEAPDAIEQVASDNEQGEDIVAADEKQLEQQQQSVRQAQHAKRDDDLDDALEDTFPASDPVNLTPDKPEKAAKAP